MDIISQEQLLHEKQKLEELKHELELKNQQMWAMSETVYKEKIKIEAQLNDILSQKLILEKQKNENDENVKQLWEQSTAIHNEKQRIEILKAEVENRHQEMIDSVEYAKRIQLAVLPTEEAVKAILPNSFIYFMPKNIVSGDFFWVHKLDDDRIYFAAIDCTGHGVPGAFMSILANSLLEQAIKNVSDYSPGNILTELSTLIIRALKQTSNFDSVRDSMDIALCLLDFENLKLEFAGAHNPLLLLRNGGLQEFKADKKSIGLSYAKSTTFENHKIDLQKGDCLYIFSDGFVDQKGGPNKTKYFFGNFKTLLTTLHNKKIDTQKEIIADVFDKWKGDNQQIDDVLVFGVYIG